MYDDWRNLGDLKGVHYIYRYIDARRWIGLLIGFQKKLDAKVNAPLKLSLDFVCSISTCT